MNFQVHFIVLIDMVMYVFKVVTVNSLNFPVFLVECCEPVPNTCMEMLKCLIFSVLRLFITL